MTRRRRHDLRLTAPERQFVDDRGDPGRIFAVEDGMAADSELEPPLHLVGLKRATGQDRPRVPLGLEQPRDNEGAVQPALRLHLAARMLIAFGDQPRVDPVGLAVRFLGWLPSREGTIEPHGHQFHG